MACPEPRVKPSDQPLTGRLPVLVMVMLSTRPSPHASTALVTRQAPVPPGDDGPELGGWELGGWELGPGEPRADELPVVVSIVTVEMLRAGTFTVTCPAV